MNPLRCADALMRRFPRPLYLAALAAHSFFRLRKRHLLRFEVNVTDHCNLNCSGCEHFSSIAEDHYVNPAALEKDFERLSVITGGKIEMLHLMGGEPLLHPDIVAIMKMSRKYFPRGSIKVVSNGLLISKMKDDFWQAARESKIIISVTRYPIKIDFDAIRSLAAKNNARFEFFNIGAKSMQKRPLDLTGAQNIYSNFRMCHMANYCVQLRAGKIYPCVVIAYIVFFNKYFSQNLIVSDNDYIDIYKARTLDDITSFLIKPPPFCRYCNIKKITRNIKWSVSKKDISEWI